MDVRRLVPASREGTSRRTVPIAAVAALMVAALVIAPTPLRRPSAAQAAGVAPAISAATNRRTLSIDPGWRFLRGDASGAQATAFDDSGWERVSLPHTVRLEPALNSGVKNYQGIAWYRRHLALDNSFAGRRIFVRFEGAMQVADVWLNGVSLGQHQGGYTPFVFDVTSGLKLDGTDVLAVRLDNRDNALVPPGKPESGLDFNYYGGLYRDVKLVVTDPLHITDANFANVVGGGGVFVSTPTVSTGSATVQVKTHVQNSNSRSAAATVKTSVLDPAGTVVASGQATANVAAGAATTVTQSLTVTNPRLWSPDSPTLYKVVSEVDDGATPVDDNTVTLGIRSINWSKAGGFQLNGRRFIINGTNRHQEYPYVGYAVPASGAYRDALLLKEGGANFVRASHYPPDPAFLDACDQLGILVMDAIPGWQNFNSNTTFTNNSFNDIRQMVRRDRNHPSVVVWESSLNESQFTDSYAQTADDITHAEYPGNQTFTYGADTTNAGNIFDVQNPATSTNGPAALIYREYGDWEFGGNESTSRTQRSDGEAKNLVAVANKQQAWDRILTPASGFQVAGGATWSGFDYNRGYNPNPAFTGLMDWFRLPKFTYSFYRSQRDPAVVQPGIDSGPALTIANWWTPSSPADVTVYANVQKVNLFVNDRMVASQSPDTGGTNAHVAHPPFTFRGVAKATGTLRADGLINNTVVVSQTVRTPGTATRIVVTVDTAKRSLIADGTDFAIVHASVVDANGTVVPTNSTSITFSVSGQGALIGSGAIGANPVVAGAGIGSALVRSTTTAGALTITASASGLTSGTASVTTVPSTTPTLP